MLSVQEIINSNDVKITKLEVKEWNGEIGLKEMNGSQREKFENILAKNTDKNGRMVDFTNLRSTLLIQVICDEDGKCLFTRDSMSKLNEKNAEVLNYIFEKALTLNGLDKTSKDIEKKS